MKNEELVEMLQKEYDQELMSQLWTQMEKFVKKIASRYVPALRCWTPESPEDDLLQEGYFGLVKAIDKYDPSRGQSFANFSAYYLHSAFSDFIGKQSGSSRGTNFKIRMLKRFESEYYELTGKKPKDIQIRVGIGVTQGELESLRKRASSEISINASGDDEDDRTLLEEIPDPTVNVEDEVIDRIVRNQVHDLLIQYVMELPDLQRRIITLTYFGGRSVKDVCERLGISRPKYDRERAKALNRIGRTSHRAEIGRFLPERFQSGAYRGSLSRFRTSGSSSTELTAFRNLRFQHYTE